MGGKLKATGHRVNLQGSVSCNIQGSPALSLLGASVTQYWQPFHARVICKAAFRLAAPQKAHGSNRCKRRVIRKHLTSASSSENIILLVKSL